MAICPEIATDAPVRNVYIAHCGLFSSWNNAGYTVGAQTEFVVTYQEHQTRFSTAYILSLVKYQRWN